MTNIYFYLTEGSRIFITSWKHRLFKKKLKGNAKQICEQIVKNCWNGKYFQTSTTNFPQFWTRDFGWCTKSLLKLGYKKEVHKTIRYALNCFQKKGKITTTISPKNKPFDFPNYSVDSLPWLIHSIKISKFDYNNYLPFLNKEIIRFFNIVINNKTKLVTENKQFSSMKDFSIRKSSCYDNCMLIMLINDIMEINHKNHVKKLKNPFYHHKSISKTKKYYTDLLIENFWNEEYFYDDLQKKDYFASDANIFPIMLGITSNKKIINKIINRIISEELDQPLPLCYTKKNKEVSFIPQELFLKNYEFNTAWTHMGPLWIKTVKHYHPELAKEYKLKYKKMIEKEGGFVEVLNKDGKIFNTPFYYADKTMLWAANYLTI